MSTDDMNTPTTTDDDAVPLLDRNLYRTIKKMDRNTLLQIVLWARMGQQLNGL